MNYEIETDFDDDNSDIVQLRIYYQFLDKHNAMGIGHEKTHTSTIFMQSEKPLDIGKLTNDLGDIKILSVKKVV